MSILKKIWTGIRGHASEAGEAVVDANALTILEQEIRDSDTALVKAKQALTQIMAQEKGAARAVAKTKADIETYMGHAQKAKDANKTDLLNQAIEKVQELQGELGAQESAVVSFAKNVETIKARVKTTEKTIKALKSRLKMAKAQDKVLKAQEITAAQHGGSDNSATSASETLRRLEERQKETADRMDAASELAEESDPAAFEKKMQEAGLLNNGPSADDIMSKLK